jgi:hypothetical protein
MSPSSLAMTFADDIAHHILKGNALEVRSLVQDWRRDGAPLSDVAAPTVSDPEVWAVAAGVVELLALRANQAPPSWTSRAAPLPEPLYLVSAAHRSTKLRERIERESPEPLRRRNLFAPPGYLELV